MPPYEPPATAVTPRYTNRKEHDCGCITVRDTASDDVHYVKACGAHRYYATNHQAASDR